MAKSAKKFGIKFEGFQDIAEQYEKLGGDLKKITEQCLEFIPGDINPKLETAMQKHKRTGRTVESIAKDQQVEWEGNKASIKVGFNLSHGGLASIFLMYGTARHAPANQYGSPKKPGARTTGMEADKELFNSIYGSAIQKQISAKQAEIFEKALEKITG